MTKPALPDITANMIDALPSGTRITSRRRDQPDLTVIFHLWAGNISDRIPQLLCLHNSALLDITDNGTLHYINPASFLKVWEPVEITDPTAQMYAHTAATFTRYNQVSGGGCRCEWEWKERYLPGNPVEPEMRRPIAVNDTCPRHGIHDESLL